jgi:hypothetical protein
MMTGLTRPGVFGGMLGCFVKEHKAEGGCALLRPAGLVYCLPCFLDFGHTG